MVTIDEVKAMAQAGQRVVAPKANLTDADFNGANLSGADFSGALLGRAKLDGANLVGANLVGANLFEASLFEAHLVDADFTKANLVCADLRRAELCRANLTEADLDNADFSGADLSGANFSGVYLEDVNLSGANLIGAQISGRTVSITIAEIELLLKVADHVASDPLSLYMDAVHICETVHCGAGWTIFLADGGRALEEEHGWHVAACILCPIPEFTGLFYATRDDSMLRFLQWVAADRGRAIAEKYGVNLR
jgi:hypothetical protein